MGTNTDFFFFRPCVSYVCVCAYILIHTFRCVVWTGDDRVFFFNPTIHLSVWETPGDLIDRDISHIIEDPPHKRKKTTSIPEDDDRDDKHKHKSKRSRWVWASQAQRASDLLMSSVLINIAGCMPPLSLCPSSQDRGVCVPGPSTRRSSAASTRASYCSFQRNDAGERGNTHTHTMYITNIQHTTVYIWTHTHTYKLFEKYSSCPT